MATSFATHHCLYRIDCNCLINHLHFFICLIKFNHYSPGARSNKKKRLVPLRRKWAEPKYQRMDDQRSVRFRAYQEREEAKALAQQNEEVPATLAESAQYADELDRCDEQKRRLREKGHFFFVHPHSEPDAFPAAIAPAGMTPYEAPKIFPREGVPKKKKGDTTGSGMDDDAEDFDEDEEEEEEPREGDEQKSIFVIKNNDGTRVS